VVPEQEETHRHIGSEGPDEEITYRVRTLPRATAYQIPNPDNTDKAIAVAPLVMAILTYGVSLTSAGPGMVVTRVAQLADVIPAAQSGRITMAVGLTEDANGVESTLISTSEPGGYLRPGVTLEPGETLVPGTGHAEMDIAKYTYDNGLFLKQIGATRPVCQGCASGLPWGTEVVTPLKPGVF
jgi:hypothetical protein